MMMNIYLKFIEDKTVSMLRVRIEFEDRQNHIKIRTNEGTEIDSVTFVPEIVVSYAKMLQIQ